MKYRIRYKDMWGNPHQIEFEAVNNDAAWDTYQKWESDKRVIGNPNFSEVGMERIIQEEKTEQVVGIVPSSILR